MSEHSFSVEDAMKYGIEGAVIIKNLKFWLDKNIANKKHVHDGEVWTYNSIEAFHMLFPYLKPKQIIRVLEKLKNKGVIKTGNFNAKKYDRTKWYTLTGYYNTFLSISRNGQMEFQESGNGFTEMGKPIPDSNTDGKPDNSLDEPEGKSSNQKEVEEIHPPEYYLQSPQPHVRLLGYYFRRKGIEFENVEQQKLIFKMNLQWASKITKAKFHRDKILEAFDRAEQIPGKADYNLSTVLKYLTK